MSRTGVTGRAFGKAFSLAHGDWLEVEIVGVPFVAFHGGHAVKVWVPSVVGPYAYTDAALAGLIPQTPLARELLRLTPIPEAAQ